MQKYLCRACNQTSSDAPCVNCGRFDKLDELTVDPLEQYTEIPEEYCSSEEPWHVTKNKIQEAVYKAVPAARPKPTLDQQADAMISLLRGKK